MASKDDIILINIFAKELLNGTTLSKQDYSDLNTIIKKIKRIRREREEQEKQTIQEYELQKNAAEKKKHSNESVKTLRRDRKRYHKMKKRNRALLRLSHDVNELIV